MAAMLDLVALVPDKDMEFALSGLLPRHDALGIRPVSCEIIVHWEHDPGCRLHCREMLQAKVRTHAHALVMFDRHGCGGDATPCDVLEREVEGRLAASGWQGRAGVVVIDPELETWVWSQSPHVARVLGWEGRVPSLADWLRARGYLAPGAVKPRDPKQAMEEALRVVRKPRSSALYRDLAECVSLARCTDRAFLRLKDVLSGWFGRGDEE